MKRRELEERKAFDEGKSPSPFHLSATKKQKIEHSVPKSPKLFGFDENLIGFPKMMV